MQMGPRSQKRAMAFSFPYVGRARYEESAGVNELWSINTEAIGKDNEDNPYLIPNEWIAANIGHFLGLPIPPFAIMRRRRRDTMMFASIRFDVEESPPDVVAAQLWKSNPHLCTGILLFDILIANCDRHGSNLKVDNPTNPKRVHVFDHERALFYVYPDEGIERLKDMANRLGVSGGSVTGGSRHCLIDIISTVDHFEYWLKFIEQLPLMFIENICRQTYKLGANKREVKAVIRFLRHRREIIGELIYSNRAEFPSIKDWRLFP